MAQAGLVISKLGCVVHNQLILVFSTFVIEDGQIANLVCLKLPQGHLSSPEVSVDHTFILNRVIFPRGDCFVPLLRVWSGDLLMSKSLGGYGHESWCELLPACWSPLLRCTAFVFI